MYENVTVWGIHAGAMGQGAGLFLSKGSPIVAIGWPEMGDLSRIKQGREDFKDKLKKAYPDTKRLGDGSSV